MADTDFNGAASAGETMLVADAAAETLAPRGRAAGEQCANCGASLAGRHCHACGQVADDLRRPIWALIKDSLEGLFALDGRLLRTLPRLMFKPGAVSAEYLAGRRARYVPPFRLFLLSALSCLLVVSVAAGDWTSIESYNRPLPSDEASRDQRLAELERSRAALEAVIARLEAGGREVDDQLRASLDVLEAEAQELENAVTPDAIAAARDTQRLRQLAMREDMKCDVRRVLLPEELGPCPAERPAEQSSRINLGDLDASEWPIGARRYLTHQAEVVIDDPSRFLEAINRWLPRVLIGLFPVYALLLGVSHFWKRRFLYYDHIVVSLHFHAFVFILLTTLIAVSLFLPLWLLIVVFLAWSNLYLYRAHRLVYGCGRFSSAVRTGAIDLAYLVCVLSFAPIMLAIGGFMTA